MSRWRAAACGTGRRGAAQCPVPGGEALALLEVARSGGEFRGEVHAAVQAGLAAQVGEELAGLGGGAAGGAGDQSCLVLDRCGVHAVGGVGQAVGGEGDAVEGLRDGVVHLACEARPFLLDGLVDGEAGAGLRQGVGGGAEAEQQAPQAAADGPGQDAQSGDEQRGEVRFRVAVHRVRGADQQALEGANTAPRQP